MRQVWLLVLALALASHATVRAQLRHQHADVEDNEFAEFEDFDSEDGGAQEAALPADDAGLDQADDEEVGGEEEAAAAAAAAAAYDDEEEATVSVEDDEFEHNDDDEFEGMDAGDAAPSGSSRGRGPASDADGPKITFAKLPAHLRSNWEGYLLEIAILAGLSAYFVNFMVGRARNGRIAEAWYAAFAPMLRDNFALVGDDGKLDAGRAGLVKESENVYLLWCSGRTCCEGVLFELRLAKRQDLLSVLLSPLRPVQDQVHVRVLCNHDDMDTYVLCLAAKKAAAKLAKDMADLSVFCPERKPTDRYGLPAGFVLMSEIGEAAQALLDQRVCAVVSKMPDVIESMHFSDQYSGVKQAVEDQQQPVGKMPDTRKMLVFILNLPFKNGGSIGEVVESTRPALHLVFYLMERIKRFRLSKESKAKAEKNRLKVEEAFLKSTHAARAEAAAARREEKRRAEKERILQEDDPEKQRKWEEKENKRLAKKRMPKMKAIKV